MNKLSLGDISDVRAYEREREDFRREVIALKKLRRIGVGPIVTVVFENRTTMRFQIQEMARAEKILSDAALEKELHAYNLLIPEVGELSMTVFLELTSQAQLREWLPKLVGIERSFVLRIGQGADLLNVRGELDEGHASQLTREETTAAVHYVRFRLDLSEQRRFIAERAVLVVEHPSYQHEYPLSRETKDALVADWS
ncbi:MAG TPA: DUF3501 family protein [Acidimicrobiales bacterium]|nr:DUF3501 family protein [Acidimicrobiales bacterium]